MIKTLKLRIKDKHTKQLIKHANSVNTVWNFVNELSQKHWDRKREILSAYDLQPYTKGSGVELDLPARTIQSIQEIHYARRKQFKKTKLKWRTSNGSKRSLGWIPFKESSVKLKNGKLCYSEKEFDFWDSYELKFYKIGGGSFNEDSRGRWYININVEIPELCGPVNKNPSSSIGIDLGIKDCATTSDGEKLKGGWGKRYEKQIIKAQKSKNKKKYRALNAKVANKRRDDIHKFTTYIVDKNSMIFIGDISLRNFIKTKMMKGIYDASWSSFKTILSYKCHRAGVVFDVIDESYTSQTCSFCGSIPSSSPKGKRGLDIREWTCCECGTVHDRDINAAKNILARGHARLSIEIS